MDTILPVQNKNFPGDQKSPMKFLEPTRKPKVIYSDNSQEFGKSCEELSWNHCTSTPHRSETSGIAERAVRRVKEGHLRCYCSPVWMKNGGQIPWNAIPVCGTFKISCLMGNTLRTRFGQPFKGPIIPFGSLVEYYPISAKDLSRLDAVRQESLTTSKNK